MKKILICALLLNLGSIYSMFEPEDYDAEKMSFEDLKQESKEYYNATRNIFSSSLNNTKQFVNNTWETVKKKYEEYNTGDSDSESESSTEEYSNIESTSNSVSENSASVSSDTETNEPIENIFAHAEPNNEQKRISGEISTTGNRSRWKISFNKQVLKKYGSGAVALCILGGAAYVLYKDGSIQKFGQRIQKYPIHSAVALGIFTLAGYTYITTK